MVYAQYTRSSWNNPYTHKLPSYAPAARSTCVALVVRMYPGSVHCSVAKKACALDSDAMLIQYTVIGPAYWKGKDAYFLV